MFLRLLSSACLALCLVASSAHAGPPVAPTHGIDRSEWNAPQKPLRIFANTWYVGPHGLSSILVDTGQGLALFDGGLPESAPLIGKHIRALGFDVGDVKWIFNSHAHGDHAGGIAALQAASGAQVLASRDGARDLEAGSAHRGDPQYGSIDGYPPVPEVRVLRDGETVRLGDVDFTAHYTPGHTPGSTSWTWTSCDGRHCLRMVYADSLSAISAPGFRFTDHPRYVATFRAAIATVAALPCDVLLTPHPDASGFWEKVARRKSEADVAPLVDTGACRAYAAVYAKKLDARLAEERAKSKRTP